MAKAKTGIYWLGTDLRLHDNGCLQRAAASVDHLLIVYCLDPGLFKPRRYQATRMGQQRYRFLAQSLDALNSALREYGQRVFVFYQHPLDILPALVDRYQPEYIFRSAHPAIDECQQWQQLQQRVERERAGRTSDERLYAKRIQWLTLENSTLFNAEDIEQLFQIEFNEENRSTAGSFPASFSKFRRQIEGALSDSQLSITGAMDVNLSLPRQVAISPASYSEFDRYLLTDTQRLSSLNFGRGAVPESTEEGVNEFYGGEASALAHLGQYFSDAKAHHYKSVRNELSGWDNSTKFSAWLANGCLSPKLLLEALHAFERHNGRTDSSYWIFFELLWREYFYWYALYYRAGLFAFSGIEGRRPLTSFYSHRYSSWISGTTPYPLVNACMTELNTTGYLSNRGRQIVASCFVNELQLDWRYGAAWFEQQLIDYDVASNWGNWQYLAGVGADPRSAKSGPASGRHFDLQRQQRQYDPDGTYIKYWASRAADPLSQQDDAAIIPLDFVDAADWPIA